MDHNSAHVNSSQISKKVHYAKNIEEKDNLDTFNDGENYSAISENSKSSAKYTGDANSENSVSTSNLDIEEQDASILRKQLANYEYRIRYLENENKEIHSKSSKLEKKLQFVKDNQEVFMRLKEAYINMKYNEAAGRKMIEIREKSAQTWEGIVCSSCAESEELRRQIDVMIQKYKELFVVSPGEMEHLVNTVKYLKDLIERRERSYSSNMEREHKLQNHVAILKTENISLKGQLAQRGLNKIQAAPDLAVDEDIERTLLEDRKVEEMQKFVEGLTKDMEKLKKIIIKYEKKFREMKEKDPLTNVSPLNEKEIRIVQQVLTKYQSKFYKKGAEVLMETGCISNDNYSNNELRPETSLPSSPFATRVQDDSRETTPTSIKSTDRKDESAIMMMDCLFD